MHCDEPNFSSKGLPHIERDLEIKHALLFKKYRDKLHNDPEYPCCSCERLFTRSSVTQFTFDAKNSIIINGLYLKPIYQNKMKVMPIKFIVCFHCCPIINQNKLPARCVLNGLQTEPIPKELSQLNTLGKQLIFQTIVRLGT